MRLLLNDPCTCAQWFSTKTGYAFTNRSILANMENITEYLVCIGLSYDIISLSWQGNELPKLYG